GGAGAAGGGALLRGAVGLALGRDPQPRRRRQLAQQVVEHRQPGRGSRLAGRSELDPNPGLRSRHHRLSVTDPRGPRRLAPPRRPELPFESEVMRSKLLLIALALSALALAPTPIAPPVPVAA